MNKGIVMLLTLLLWTTAAAAQEAAETAGAAPETTLEADLNLGGWFVWPAKNAGIADKYDWLHSSGAGALNVEWDPLPHRFLLDARYLNEKDYFADVDYAYRDVVVFNLLTRSVFHNLEHLGLGQDDPTTPLPSFTDRNPIDQYGEQMSMSHAFLRLKTPDFPFHLYADVRLVERKGTVQQRFLDINNLFPPAKVSESRDIDTRGTEVTVGANSHLGPVELDYNHAEKKFEALENKVLTDPFQIGTNSYQHNLIPHLESSADSVKLHTSLNGRLVIAGTYVNGDKKNDDSGSKANYSMAAGDVTWIPVNDLALFAKYRHYDQDLTNPDIVTATTALGTATYHVRDSLSASRDVFTGTARYRATDRLNVKAEYNAEITNRDIGPQFVDVTAPPANQPAWWDLPHKTVKGTVKGGITYRILKTLLVRADYSHMQVDNPAYETDPDTGDYAKATITWTPASRMIVTVGYNGAREKRDVLTQPFVDQSLVTQPLTDGERKASRDQAFGSLTLMVGKRSSVTASCGYFKNKVEQGILYETSGLDQLESGVPYSDKSLTGSLVLTHSPQDGVNIALEAKRTSSEGSWRNSGSVANTAGIAEFSDLKTVESEYSADVAVQYTRELGYEFRYVYRQSDDKLDNAMDGIVRTLLATVSMKW